MVGFLGAPEGWRVPGAVSYSFGNFELKVAPATLRCGQQSVRLKRKAWEVLRYLVEHRGRVVSQEELLQGVWGGQSLGEGHVRRNINEVRSAMREHGAPEAIETVRGHGYRFALPVRVSAVSPEATEDVGALEQRPLVGRAGPMSILTAALGRAQEGHGSVFLLRGEAGIGKTRCARELGVRARQASLSVWQGSCHEGAGAPALWPWVQILRAVRDEAEAGLDPGLSDQANSLLERLDSESEESPALGAETMADRPAAARFALLDRVVGLLLATTQTRTRLLVIDDLQWADEASLELLSLLATRVEGSRLLLVTALREPEARSLLQRPACKRLPRMSETLVLQALTADEVAEYVRQVTGTILDPQLREALASCTGGNPFFLQEILRPYLDGRHAGGLSAMTRDSLELPDAARNLLMERLDSLPRATRETPTSEDADHRPVCTWKNIVRIFILGRRLKVGDRARALCPLGLKR